VETEGHKLDPKGTIDDRSQDIKGKKTKGKQIREKHTV
jgi:hypothetical protein